MTDVERSYVDPAIVAAIEAVRQLSLAQGADSPLLANVATRCTDMLVVAVAAAAPGVDLGV